MRSELDISNRQADSLREEEQKIEADLQKEIAALRDKARQRLIKTLDRSQQEKIDDLIGDTFEFQPPTRAKAAGGKRAGSSKGGYFKGKSGKGGK